MLCTVQLFTFTVIIGTEAGRLQPELGKAIFGGNH